VGRPRKLGDTSVDSADGERLDRTVWRVAYKRPRVFSSLVVTSRGLSVGPGGFDSGLGEGRSCWLVAAAFLGRHLHWAPAGMRTIGWSGHLIFAAMRTDFRWGAGRRAPLRFVSSGFAPLPAAMARSRSTIDRKLEVDQVADALGVSQVRRSASGRRSGVDGSHVGGCSNRAVGIFAAGSASAPVSLVREAVQLEKALWRAGSFVSLQ
jgi:hypothetical protein